MIKRSPPQSARLPDPPNFEEGGLSTYLRSLKDGLLRELNNRFTKTDAIPSLLIISVSGRVYKITVSDAGILATEEVAS